MSGERRAQTALAVMLIVIFGGAPLIVVSERVFHYSLGLAMALFAALPVVAIRFRGDPAASLLTRR